MHRCARAFEGLPPPPPRAFPTTYYCCFSQHYYCFQTVGFKNGWVGSMSGLVSILKECFAACPSLERLLLFGAPCFVGLPCTF